MTADISNSFVATACSGDRLLIGSVRPNEGWFYILNRIIYAFTFGLFFGVTATGRRYIPLDGPLLFAANHASLFDPLLIGLHCPRVLVGFAKRELWRVPVLRGWLNRLEAVPVDRKRSDLAALRDALEVVERGNGLLLFPEGTRTADGEIAPLKRGVGWMACRTGAPVVPTYVCGSYEAFSRHHRVPHLKRMAVHFGKPIWPRSEGGTRSEEIEWITERLNASLHELERQYRRRDPDTKRAV